MQLVLIAAKPHDKPGDKLRVYDILKRAHDAADGCIELSSEDVTMIKRAAESQSDALYGALNQFLENPQPDRKDVEP